MQDPKLQRWQSSGSAIAGINEGEMEVMRLREENEALMDSLVRTKVELAETEGSVLAKMPLRWLICCQHCLVVTSMGLYVAKLYAVFAASSVLLMVLITCRLATCLGVLVCYCLIDSSESSKQPAQM